MKKVIIICSSILVVTGLIITIVVLQINRNNKEEQSINEEIEKNDKILEGETNVDDYFWIPNTSYSIINNSVFFNELTFAFQLVGENTCYLATFNDNSFFYKGNSYIENHLPISDRISFNKNGVWLSDYKKCTYYIDNGMIHFTPVDDSNTVYYGEYYKRDNNIEIIWNGENKRTIYDKVKVTENIDFTFYQSDLPDLYLYDVETIKYDVDDKIKSGELNSNMNYYEWAKSIQNDINSDKQFDEFWNYNKERICYIEYNESVCSNIYKKIKYDLVDYDPFDFDRKTGERIYEKINIDKWKGEQFNIYKIKKKLDDKEISKMLSYYFGIPSYDIEFSRDGSWTTAKFYIRSRKVLDTFMEKIKYIRKDTSFETINYQ